MKRSLALRITILCLSHIATAALGIAFGVWSTRRVLEGPFTGTVAAAYTAAQAQLALRSAGLTEARAAIKQHLQILERFRESLGAFPYFAERTRALAALWVRERNEGDSNVAGEHLRLAVEACRRSGMTRCSKADLETLAAPWLK